MSEVRLYASDLAAWLECLQAASRLEAARYAAGAGGPVGSNTVSDLADVLFAEYKSRIQGASGR